MTEPLPPDVLNIFCDSFERVKENPKFLDRFYDRLLGSSAEVRKLFDGVPMPHLKAMLKTTLYWPMLASDGNTTSVSRLIELGKLHCDKGVKRKHYKLWLDSLLSTVEEFDEKYNINVDRAWREVMAFGVKIMIGKAAPGRLRPVEPDADWIPESGEE